MFINVKYIVINVRLVKMIINVRFVMVKTNQLMLNYYIPNINLIEKSTAN